MATSRARRAHLVHSRDSLVRIVINSADATQDYWLTREQATGLQLPTVDVYRNETTYYDPQGRWRPLRQRDPR